MSIKESHDDWFWAGLGFMMVMVLAAMWKASGM